MAFQFYGSNSIVENYYCSYGVNPKFQREIDEAGFKIVGSDATKEARIMELRHHPFFMAALFVPQVNSRAELPNKLITAFLKANMTAGIKSTSVYKGLR